MTQSEFIKIKMTAHKPQFKDMIGMVESGKTSVLCDFMFYLHNGKSTCREAQGSNGKVYGDKTYVFTIYNNCIIRTCVDNGIKTKYFL